MLRKTHLAIGLAASLYFLPHVTNKIIFIPIVLIASILPDIDSGFSTLGERGIFKMVQMTTKHRGILHTYTFCIAVSILLTTVYPVAALPFFLGYSFHLLADSFTIRGIKPFWPLKMVTSGNIKTGGKAEKIIFFIFAMADSILLVSLLLTN